MGFPISICKYKHRYGVIATVVNKNLYNMSKKISFLEHRKEFSTVNSVLWYLLKARGPENGLCLNPYCKAPIAKYYSPLRGRQAITCRRCLSHFYPMVDSIFTRSHIPINLIFEIIFLMLASRNSVSAREIERIYAIGYPSVHRLMHEIRGLMGKHLNQPFRNTIVEIDESYVSTGTKGLSRKFQFKKGRSNVKNSNILVITERVGRACLYVIPGSDEGSIFEKIKSDVDSSTIIVTDEWKAYNSLIDKGFTHLVVNHSEKGKNRFKNGMASTNNAENIFSIIKRSVRGTYRKVTDPYLQNYLNEFAFRFNYRDEKDYGFKILLSALSPLNEHYSEKFNKQDYPDVA